MVLIVVTITLERSPILLGFVAKCPSVCNTLRWRLSHSLSLSLWNTHTLAQLLPCAPPLAHMHAHTPSLAWCLKQTTHVAVGIQLFATMWEAERERQTAVEKKSEKGREREKDRRKGGNVFLFSSSRWLNLLFFTKNCYHWLFNPQNKWCLWFHKVGQPMP